MAVNHILGYYIRSKLNGFVLDSAEGKVSQGTHVVSNPLKIDDHDNQQQLWTFNDNGTIKHLKSGLVLDIHGGDKKNLIIHPHHGGDNQKWKVDSKTGEIVNPATNHVVDIEKANTNAGAGTIAWAKDNGNNQKWEVVARFS